MIVLLGKLARSERFERPTLRFVVLWNGFPGLISGSGFLRLGRSVRPGGGFKGRVREWDPVAVSRLHGVPDALTASETLAGHGKGVVLVWEAAQLVTLRRTLGCDRR
jgi:hypothetical protein